MLLDAVQKVYRDKKPVSLTMPFFDEHGVKNFVRHELNMRVQKSVEQRYVTSVMADGCIPGVRGSPWAVGELGRPPYRLLASGTFSSAVYKAAE